jgi:hypothetical protein
MPQPSYQAAVRHTGFLNSVAVLYSTQGQCAAAEDFLHRSLALDQADGRQPAEGTQLQLADVWMRERNYGHARDLYNDIVTRDANSGDAWRGYLVVLHQQRDDRALVAEIPNIPASVRKQLETDPSFLILEASAFSSSARNQDALQLLQQARSRYTSQRHAPPAVLDIQTAWTMLAVSIDQPGLNDLLLYDKKRTDLTSKERQAIEEIYSNWSVRRAERVFETKPEKAVSILTDTGQEYPGNRNIHVALASLYLKRHDKQKAIDAFQSWGMAGAQAADYRMAAGAALSAHKSDLADQFLHQGLASFPHDSELMHMAARQDIARGNYDEGERELRSALLAMKDPDTAENAAKAPIVADFDADAATRSSSAQEGSSVTSSSTQGAVVPCKPDASRSANEARIRPISLAISHYHPRHAYLLAAALQESQPQEPQQQQPPQEPQPQTQQQPQPPQQQPQQVPPPPSHEQQQQQVEDEVEAVDNRNTPFVSAGGIGTGRIGDPGIDRLIIADSLLGGWYVASNRVKLGVEGHGVYAYAGTPNGSSNQPFGTLPGGALFGTQSKIGYSGIAQLSTNTYGLAFGTTPQGFAVHNLIGGFRYQPEHGWFTIQGMRDAVKDSLLSYAGARDPGTGLRWGGVVSNTGTVRFDSAPSTNIRYKTIGEYASGSYSFMQGLHVPDNWNVAGNAGLYWQIVPGLTVGANVSGMHYNRNLQYYSFGQGGYFSPQEYYLASIPITWYSRHPRFEYEVRFSGGAQYLKTDSSLFYPALPGAAPVTQGIYGPSHDTAPNYDGNVRIGYRVAPRLYLDAFGAANNSRDYYTQCVGFSLKFMINPIPASTDLPVNSIPDWTGKQPFSVR